MIQIIIKKKKLMIFTDPTSIDLETIKLANRAIVKFFVCCGIPFSTTSHPFFRILFIFYIQVIYLLNDQNYLKIY
jgi:hypothetical protein